MTHALAINANNCATNDPCAICGGRCDPRIGAELFLAGTPALVCYDCGERLAPELMRILLADYGSCPKCGDAGEWYFVDPVEDTPFGGGHNRCHGLQTFEIPLNCWKCRETWTRRVTCTAGVLDNIRRPPGWDPDTAPAPISTEPF